MKAIFAAALLAVCCPAMAVDLARTPTTAGTYIVITDQLSPVCQVGFPRVAYTTSKAGELRVGCWRFEEKNNTVYIWWPEIGKPLPYKLEYFERLIEVDA